MGLVKIAHGATPDGGDAGRCIMPKLKNCRANKQSRKEGMA